MRKLKQQEDAVNDGVGWLLNIIIIIINFI